MSGSEGVGNAESGMVTLTTARKSVWWPFGWRQRALNAEADARMYLREITQLDQDLAELRTEHTAVCDQVIGTVLEFVGTAATFEARSPGSTAFERGRQWGHREARWSLVQKLGWASPTSAGGAS